MRGHLLSYARFLEVDPTAILRAYDREFQDGASSLQRLDRQVRVARRPQRPRWLLAAVLATVALVTVSAVGLLHGPGEKRARDLTLPALPPRLDREAPASREMIDRRAERATLQTRAVPAAAPIVLTIVTKERCWVEAVADGKTIFSGVLPAGGQRSVTAANSLRLTLGNAGSAQLTFNGVAQTLHATGVWRGTFGPSGLL